MVFLVISCALSAACGSDSRTEAGDSEEAETAVQIPEEIPERAIITPVTEESYRVLKRAGAGQDVFLQEDISLLVEQARKNASAAVQPSADPGDAGTSGETENGSEDTPEDEGEKQEDAGDSEGSSDETYVEEAGDEKSEESADPVQEAPKPATGGGKVVCIDAGHQRKQNSAKEPVGPGSSETKMKVTSGTSGTTTGVPEYQLTLAVALKLQSVLQQRGYTVVMCRSSHDVDISNVERAQVANNAGAGAFIRIHADGAQSASATGASTLAPSASNPYCAQISSSSQSLAKNVINSYCAKTGMKNRGMQINDGMTGLNWSQVPVTIIEMGFMTNPSDDQLMETESFQQSAAEGIADGIDAFFAGR